MFNKLVLLTSIVFSLNLFAQEKVEPKMFSFLGHVVIKNSVPAPLTIVLFEGDFQLAPEADSAMVKAGLEKKGIKLESEIFVSMINDQPALVLMLISKGDEKNVFVMDLSKNEVFQYNVSLIENEYRIISKKAGYTDYIVEVTPPGQEVPKTESIIPPNTGYPVNAPATEAHP